ncbi:MAG: hypothetical protein Fur0016_03760 [Anaerolineales bacterium]
MRQTTLTVTGAATLEVTNVSGDLQIVGWDRPEITAKADGDTLTLMVDDDTARASSDSDLILYIPCETTLRIANVGGDADIRAVTGAIEISNVGGDLQMRNIGLTTVRSMGGDLSVRDCKGNFVAENVGGDASLHQIGGGVSISVGADLYLREVEGNISAQVSADAALYLRPKPGQLVSVQAASDILLRVPSKIDAEFTLQGCDDESIRVDLPGFETAEPGMFHQFTVGTGKAKISLTAGDEVIVTSREDEWQSVADFDPLGREGSFAPGEFPGISAEIQEKISRKIEEATRRAMKASIRAQEQSDRVQHRVDAAMRRAEEKMRSAERRTAHMGISVARWGVNFGAPKPPRPPVPPSPPSEPITDDERLTVLKMLQEKKISLQEAEKLLAALEGK